MVKQLQGRMSEHNKSKSQVTWSCSRPDISVCGSRNLAGTTSDDVTAYRSTCIHQATHPQRIACQTDVFFAVWRHRPEADGYENLTTCWLKRPRSWRGGRLISRCCRNEPKQIIRFASGAVLVAKVKQLQGSGQTGGFQLVKWKLSKRSLSRK